MKTWLWGYAAALLAFGLLDAFWLGLVARNFYQHEAGEALASQVRWGPALIFYFGYPALLVTLALTPTLPETTRVAATRAALVGLIAYGTFDLTVLATMRGWSTKLALLDMTWGVLASALAGAAAHAAMAWHSPSADSI